jgi:sulfur relay (sulfurtransferase) DsrC/TusE family protein
MAFTMEAIETPAIANPTGPKEFDLPSKEFVGYDPKGTTTVTGSQKSENPKQETTSESAPAAQPAKPEESITLSPKISAIARAEQVRLKREQALIQREKALEARLADADKYAQLKSKIANKDYSAADELGLTYDEYTEYLTRKQADANPEEQRYRKVEDEIKTLKKAQEEQAIKEYEANQALWKQEISKVVAENEEFSTIKELGLEHVVLQHVNDSFEEDGIELTVEAAAKEIESELVKRAEKFASVSKIKKKAEDAPRVLGAPKTQPKTITQNMTVTSQKPSTKPLHLMSEMEQWEEARRRVEAARQGR